MLKSAVKCMCAAVIALAGSGMAARGDWEIQGEGIDSWLWDVCFVDALHGWAVGNNSTIIHTGDGGKTWINQECPIEDGSLRQVHFFDTHTGYAVCINTTTIPATSYLLHTRDSGIAWRIVQTNMDFRWIKNICFLDENTGWMSVSIKGTAIDGVVHTIDGGKTWELQYEALPSGFSIGPIVFVNENRGWALYGGYDSSQTFTYVRHTFDGGKTWLEGSKVNDMWARNVMKLIPPKTLWVSRYALNVSYNGGETWNLVSAIYKDGVIMDVHQEGAIMDVHPLSGTEAYVLQRGELLYTDDGGMTLNSLLDFSDMQKMGVTIRGVGRDTVWIVGQGLIIKYCMTNVSVKEHSYDEPITYGLRNSPNPFNAATTIKFTLAVPSPVTLTVYDCTGRKVATLIDNAPLTPGEHEAVFDGSSLASGVYIYRCRAGNATRCGRMTLMK